MRGKVEAAILAMERNGITPACAGKSAFFLSLLSKIGDHPRVCGEKCQHLQIVPSAVGSPPRVRGKACKHMLKLALERITPACAGKRPSTATSVPPPPDHPRVCGEKTLDYPPLFKGWGSPPRVRGKVDARYVLQAVSRITPACAGKSHLFSSSIGLYSDHPRVCGEKLGAGSICFL